MNRSGGTGLCDAGRQVVGVGVGVGIALICTIVSVSPAAAQITAQCAQEAAAINGLSSQDQQRIEQYCNVVGQSIEITQPRLGVSLSGGNPLPGTASTLGMRLGSLPRVSVDIRATAAVPEIPDLRSEQSLDETLRFPLGSINADAGVGVFSGFSPAPTVGGMGSIDVIGSIGVIPISLAEDDGFSDGTPLTWALGARVGILRESFTLPGISVTGMFRDLGQVEYGDPDFEDEDAFFNADLSALSVRGAVSKDFLFMSATAGIGWDRYSSTVGFGAEVEDACTLLSSCSVAIRNAEIETDRVSYFGNVSLNFLIVNLVGELGWQAGGDLDDPDAPLPPGVDMQELSQDGALFGSLALRLSI
ncbi:MAG: hypothetical protein ACRELV_06585 [Longimicrobiales bacterium]